MNGLRSSSGRYAGEDNGWTAALFSQALMDFDQSVGRIGSQTFSSSRAIYRAVSRPS